MSGGVQRGDEAALVVRGTGYDQLPGDGRVILQREGGVWKVAKVIMKSPL